MANTAQKSTEEEKWVLRQITTDVRDYATQAANESGLSTGEYVEQLLAIHLKDRQPTLKTNAIQSLKNLKQEFIVLETRLQKLEKKSGIRKQTSKQLKKTSKQIKALVKQIKMEKWLKESSGMIHHAIDQVTTKMSFKKKKRTKKKK